MSQLVLCVFCLLLGGVSRFCFVGLTAAERRIKLKVVTFLLDFIWGVVTVASVACIILVFNNGIALPYMLISAMLGFSITAIFI